LPLIVSVQEDELVSGLVATQHSQGREVVAVSKGSLLDVVVLDSILEDGVSIS